MKKFLLKSPLLLIVAIMVYSLFSQCYTTFQHPTVYVPVDSTTYYEQEVTFADDCSQCHENEKKYVENETDIYADPVYQENYNWNYYFMTPWWYDPYYYVDYNPATANNDDLPPTQKRNFDRRDTTPTPGYTSPAPSGSSLSKSRSGSSNKSTPPPPTKRRERRQTISNPKKNNPPSTPSPKRVPRKDKKKKKS